MAIQITEMITIKQ